MVVKCYILLSVGCFLLHSYCKQESSYYIHGMKTMWCKKITPSKNTLKVGQREYSNIRAQANLEKTVFLWHSGKTWKTQGILRKYFTFMENSEKFVEIYFLIDTLLSSNNKFWMALFIVLFTYLVGLSDWLLFEMTYSGCAF